MKFDLNTLKNQFGQGTIDTVILCDTDKQGRLFGKRLTARHFLKSGINGLDTCSVIYGWTRSFSRPQRML